MEKRLGAALIAGDRIVSIDNCEQPLGGEFFCQALTQQLQKVRVLGKSEQITVPNAALYFATGNNLRLAGDMPRRSIIGRLDAGVERPEERIFRTEDPISVLKRDRPRYVANVLTILLAFVAAEAPEQARALGGFEDWSRLVRDALIWLGEPDPLLTTFRVRELDPQREALAAILGQWNEVLGSGRASANQVIAAATAELGGSDKKNFRHPEFREALLIVAGDSGSVSSRRLGKYLGANNGKIVDGLRIVATGLSGGIARYQLGRARESE